MIGAIHAGLAVVLIWAARDPTRHITIIYAFIVSSIFHGGFMAYLAATQEGETMHLTGNVLFNFAVAVLLFLFIPWGMLKEEDKTFLRSPG